MCGYEATDDNDNVADQKMMRRMTTVAGYIDVSKRQVDEEEEKRACEQRYVRGKLVRRSVCQPVLLVSVFV